MQYLLGNKMDIKIHVITVHAVVFTVDGCAIITDWIDLEYLSQRHVIKIPGTNGVSVVVSVNGHHQDKRKISRKKNGFCVEMTPIDIKDKLHAS